MRFGQLAFTRRMASEHAGISSKTAKGSGDSQYVTVPALALFHPDLVVRDGVRELTRWSCTNGYSCCDCELDYFGG